MKKALFLAIATTLLLGASMAQQESADPASHAGRVGMPIDWSSQHVIHGNVTNQEFADAVGKEPRVLLNYFRRQHVMAAASRGKLTPNNSNKGAIKRDWNWTLGSGTVAPNMSPAKFGFYVNAAPNCANDFAVFGLNTGGVNTGAGTAQPNLVGFNNLYAGTTGASASITAAAILGTTVTVTAANATGWTNGGYVNVTGLTPSAYNGNYQITSAGTSTTAFTYTVAANVGVISSFAGSHAILSGLCGTVPSVSWAYNVSTSTNGAVLTSPSLSMDGTQVAFVESKVSQAVISTATRSSTTVTITTTTTHGFSVGDTVVISGVTVAEYNGTFTITAVNAAAKTFTYSALVAPSASGSGGSASVAKGGAIFQVLKIGTTGDNGSWDGVNNVYHVVAPANGGATNNGSVTSVTYTANGDTFSSPYVDYAGDVAYVGDDNGTIYKSNCVFACVAHGLTLTVTQLSTAVAGVKVTSPIFDSNTNKLFYGGSDGKLYSLNLTTCVAPCAATSVAFANAFSVATTPDGGVFDAPIIDNQFSTVFVASGDTGSGTTVGAVGEFSESLASLATRSMGNAAFPIFNGVLSDAYYNNVAGTTTATPAGTYSTCGDNTGGSGQTALWSWSFTASGATPLSSANPPVLSLAALATLNLPGPTKTPCTTAIEFKNGTDLQFFGQTSSSKCIGSANSNGDGCLLTYTLTGSTAPAANKQILVHGGTSGIIVDNTSTSSQASSVYYSNEAVYTLNSINPCTYTSSNTASYCAFKVTQTGLQ